MNQTEFSILVTNTLAIANETFSINCGTFSADYSANETNISTPASTFDIEKDIDIDGLQQALNNGYASLDDLGVEMDTAWEKLDTDEFAQMLARLPTDYTDLSQKMTAEQLKAWIGYALKAKGENPLEHPFNALHQYIMMLFQNGSGFLDNDASEIIGDAIDNRDLSLLVDAEDEIKADDIEEDDLFHAAGLQVYDVFEWLSKRAQLDDNQTVSILNRFILVEPIFKRVYEILAPSEAQHAAISELANESEENEVMNFLKQVNVTS